MRLGQGLGHGQVIRLARAEQDATADGDLHGGLPDVPLELCVLQEKLEEALSVQAHDQGIIERYCGVPLAQHGVVNYEVDVEGAARCQDDAGTDDGTALDHTQILEQVMQRFFLREELGLEDVAEIHGQAFRSVLQIPHCVDPTAGHVQQQLALELGTELLCNSPEVAHRVASLGLPQILAVVLTLGRVDARLAHHRIQKVRVGLEGPFHGVDVGNDAASATDDVGPKHAT
mmetsp:Transcript_38397/g.123468  ORF Transcript_38397/g.123468 Transcript_38397/m.123468 type:complete len:231 (-) Transcript_38397:1150-1842(-)